MQLSDFTFTFHTQALEKEMATYSSVLAWRIPGTVKPGELPSVGLYRVGHDWSNLAAAAYYLLYISFFICHFMYLSHYIFLQPFVFIFHYDFPIPVTWFWASWGQDMVGLIELGTTFSIQQAICIYWMKWLWSWPTISKEIELTFEIGMTSFLLSSLSLEDFHFVT